MIKAIIVDDESRARRILKTLLEENYKDVQVLGEAEDVPSAVKLIHATKPDLVFLDVEMPGYSGFELFDFLPDEINFEVVFATAYNQYAIKAIEVSAIGYLLKPIQLEELDKTIERVRKKQIHSISKSIAILKENNKAGKLNKIALPHVNGIAFEDISDIIYLKADGSYTQFVFQNRGDILVSKKIKEYETILNADIGFFRPHRSFIINTQKVKEYVKSDGGYVIMNNGDQLSISRELKNQFLELMGLSNE